MAHFAKILPTVSLWPIFPKLPGCIMSGTDNANATESVAHHSNVEVMKLGWWSKTCRQILMSTFPASGSVNTTDLFNSGYGTSVSLICQICFITTFVYYCVANYDTNIKQRFLSPVDGTERTGVCESVSVEINNKFTIDLHGNWSNSAGYKAGETMYGVEMNRVNYFDLESYTKEMKLFHEDLAMKSALGAKRDLAWNLVFAASYSKTSFVNGATNFFVNGDSRIIYNEEVFSAGFANAYGVCKPEDATAYFDAAQGKFVLSFKPVISYNANTGYPYWEPCWGHIYSWEMGFNPAWSTNEFHLEIDSAAVTTAIAINYGLTALNTLAPAPTLDEYDQEPLFVGAD